MKEINLTNIKTLFRKEIAHYLNNSPSYVLTSVFLLISGYFYAQPLFLINQANLNSLIDIMPLVLTFFAPALAMKLIAEEKKTQTVELLMTLPLTEYEIIIAKFLASALVITASVALMLTYSFTLYLLSTPDTGHIIGTYLSLLFTSYMFLSAGIFASSLSSSQITAFIIGFAISFFFFIMGKVTIFVPVILQPLTTYIGVDSHISNMARGVIDFKDIVYYLSVTFVFLYLTTLKLKGMRKG